MNLQKLKEAKAGAIGKMDAILAAAEKEENRALTADEKAEWDKLEKEVAELDENIARVEKHQSNKASLAAVTPAASRVGSPIHAPGPEAKKEFENIGEFMHAVVYNPNDQRLSFQEMDLRGEQRMDTGTKGGFMIPKQFRDTLLSVDPQGSVIRPRATVIPAGDPADAEITMPALNQASGSNMHGGVEVTWTGTEGTDADETDADFREISLRPQEMSAFVGLTNKLLRNWGAASATIEKLLRGAMISAEELAFLRGTGAGQPMGILNSAALVSVNRTTANVVKHADLANMLGRIRNMSGAVFQYNQRLLPQLINLADADGRLIWQSSARDGLPATLMGLPAIVNQHCPALGTKGDLTLCNLQDYLIKDGSGPLVSASEHAEFKKSKTLIKLIWNVDGQPWLNAPIVDEDSNSYSPFVALDVPA